ncbi:MAG: DNA recombination protein RmuC [Planctomycetota bacterium]|nr:MAG: DNA recombination protein RmuC [Planctomycetota bacterium]
MEPLTYVFAALAAAACVAAVIGWRRAARVEARARDAEHGRQLAEARLSDSEQGERKMRDSFDALAARALQAQGEQFLALAEQRLGAQQARADASIEKSRREVDALVKPIGDALAKTHDELAKLEKARDGAYQGLTRQVTDFQQQASKLADALRRPNVRGRYGEIQLQRVVELAGMRDWCDFSMQSNSRSTDGQLHRPDLIVKLPNGRLLAVDAKCSLDGYLDAFEAQDPAVRDAALARFAMNVVEQVTRLSSRQYWADFEQSPELVVMFVPGDQFIDAALQAKPELVELAAQKNIVLASPATLIGLLRAVALGWRERNVSESAAELLKHGKLLHERSAKVLEYAARVGENLGRTVAAYNDFATSVDARLMPSLRRFEELGAKSAKALEAAEQLERVPKRIESIEAELVPAPRRESEDRAGQAREPEDRAGQAREPEDRADQARESEERADATPAADEPAAKERDEPAELGN